MCGVTHVTVAALIGCSSLLFISNSDWTTQNEDGRSASVNCNEEPRWWDFSPIQFSCNCNYSLITHNKTPVHSTRGLMRVRAAWPTPRLNPSTELRPSWERHPRYVPRRVRNGYNKGVSSIHRNSWNSETNPTVIRKMRLQYLFQDCAYWNLSRIFRNGNSLQLQGSYQTKFSYCNMHMNHHVSISGTETHNVIKSQVTVNIWIILYYLPETLSASPSNWHN